MSSSNDTLVMEHRNGEHTPPSTFQVPHFPQLEEADRQFPSLYARGAYPIVRDRWERLVTVTETEASPKAIWHALTDPDALKEWLAVSRGSLGKVNADCILDFEDGEFFYCHTVKADAPNRLQYLWRWLGVGQATSVTWDITPTPAGTRITVTEEAKNPPWDWQTWNGGGWPGILDQLTTFVRAGINTRWPWRRMGPYAQIELPVSIYEAWDKLFSESGLRYWMQVMKGKFQPGEAMTVMMGDASGAFTMNVHRVVPPGQEPPSFLPFVEYSITRPVWNCEIYGRAWIEPAGWGKSLLQAFHYNWENLPANLQLSERFLVTNFFRGAAGRAQQICMQPLMPQAPHSWSS